MPKSSTRLSLLQRIAQNEQRIRAFPASYFTSAQIRAMGLFPISGSAVRWALALDIPMNEIKKNGEGESFTVKKEDLLHQLERIKTMPPEALATPPETPATFYQARQSIFNSLVSAPVAEQFTKFQRDFAATIDALHQVFVDHSAQQQPKLDAIATLAETAVAFARQAAQTMEQIEKDMADINEYFERQQNVNRILFRQIESANAGIDRLNKELGVKT